VTPFLDSTLHSASHVYVASGFVRTVQLHLVFCVYLCWFGLE